MIERHYKLDETIKTVFNSSLLVRRIGSNIMSCIYLFLFAYLSFASARQYVRVCYYTNWSQYRTQPMNYKTEDIDPSLCSHIIFAFAQINGADHTLQTIEWNDEEAYAKFSEMKTVKLSINFWYRIKVKNRIRKQFRI